MALSTNLLKLYTYTFSHLSTFFVLGLLTYGQREAANIPLEFACICCLESKIEQNEMVFEKVLKDVILFQGAYNPFGDDHEEKQKHIMICNGDLGVWI